MQYRKNIFNNNKEARRCNNLYQVVCGKKVKLLPPFFDARNELG
jgi:hypothetical protein